MPTSPFILFRLEACNYAAHMDLPGLRLHSLRGSLDGFFAVDVSANWQLIFCFDIHGNAVDVDLIDVH